MQIQYNPFPNLISLNLSGNAMDIYSLQLMVSGSKCNAFGMLQELLLNSCYIENSGFSELAKALKRKTFPSLIKLGLNHDSCADDLSRNSKLSLFCEALRTGCCRHLQYIDLSCIII